MMVLKGLTLVSFLVGNLPQLSLILAPLSSNLPLLVLMMPPALTCGGQEPRLSLFPVSAEDLLEQGWGRSGGASVSVSCREPGPPLPLLSGA